MPGAKSFFFLGLALGSSFLFGQTQALVLDLPRQSKAIELSAGMGVPDLFSLSAAKSVSADYKLGFSLGYLPLGLLLPTKMSRPVGTLQDGYKMEILPRSHLFASAFFLRHYPMQNSVFLQAQVGVWVGSVGGEGVLRNELSQKAIPVASLDVMVFQPTLAASIGGTLLEWRGSSLEASLGFSFLLPAALNTMISGSGPAFLEVIPEWRERITESFPQAEAEITQILRSTWLAQRFLPAINLRYRF